MNMQNELAQTNILQMGVQPTSAPSARQGLLVLGMHRSGTSAMSGVLGKLGCALPADLGGPGIGNEKGHWECQGAVSLNDRILESGGSHWEDWDRFNPAWYTSLLYQTGLEDARAVLRASFDKAPLFVLKDPRLCKLVPLWLAAFEAEAISPAIVVCLRHPAEVAASLAARDGMELGYAHLLWMRYTLEAESETRGRKRVICNFDQLQQDWLSLSMRIGLQLGVVWPKQSAATRRDIDQFLAPTSPRSSSVSFHPEFDPMPWANRVHEILKRWSEQGEDRSDDAELDEILRRFDAAANGFANLILPGSRSLGAGGAHMMKEALTQAEANLAAHLDAHDLAINELKLRLEAALNSETSATALLAERTGQMALVESALRQREEEIAQTVRDRDEAQADVTRAEFLLDDLKQQLAVEQEEKLRLQEAVSALEARLAELEANFAKADKIVLHQEWFGQINAFLMDCPRWWAIMPAAWQRRRRRVALMRRGLFDAETYLQLYPDVAAKGVDPLQHYISHGVVEGRRLAR